jgi:hypothetical protein
MTRKLSAWMTALIVIAALALPGGATAQQHRSAPSRSTAIESVL